MCVSKHLGFMALAVDGDNLCGSRGRVDEIANAPMNKKIRLA